MIVVPLCAPYEYLRFCTIRFVGQWYPPKCHALHLVVASSVNRLRPLAFFLPYFLRARPATRLVSLAMHLNGNTDINNTTNNNMSNIFFTPQPEVYNEFGLIIYPFENTADRAGMSFGPSSSNCKWHEPDCFYS